MATIRAILRIVLGFTCAMLVAGTVEALYVLTPAEIHADRERLAGLVMLALYAATHSAVFALPLAIITILTAEWLSLRSGLFYVAAGLAIAGAGFLAEYMGEAGPTTIWNDYAFRAFATAGVFGGLVYWTLAGRFAGAPRRQDTNPPPKEA